MIPELCFYFQISRDICVRYFFEKSIIEINIEDSKRIEFRNTSFESMEKLMSWVSNVKDNMLFL